jgi:hypothetical protein
VAKVKPYPKFVSDLMEEKSSVLSRAQALAAVGMADLAGPAWVAAAGHEERLAPLLETLGRDLEAAVHRISAASCYHKAGELARAANLYRAALAGPLHDDTRHDVQRMLGDCLAELARSASPRAPAGPPRKK